jgi:tetratricopeptide (TPR) repeat protein
MGFRLNLAIARGQFSLARETLHQAEEALDRLHLQGRAELEAGMGSAEAMVGEGEEGIRDSDQALKLSRSLSVMANVAITFALCGEDQKALALADEIQRTHPNDTLAVNVNVPLIRAVVVLRTAHSSKPDPAKALDFLNTAALYARSNSGVFYARGLAYEQAGRYPEAQQDFEKVLSFKYRMGPDLMLQAAQLRLARLFQKEGDLPKARIAYQNFLTAWKDADPNLPLLHEAKAEYAKLQ